MGDPAAISVARRAQRLLSMYLPIFSARNTMLAGMYHSVSGAYKPTSFGEYRRYMPWKGCVIFGIGASPRSLVPNQPELLPVRTNISFQSFVSAFTARILWIVSCH